MSPQKASLYVHTMPNHANDDYFDFDNEQKDDSFEDLFNEAINNRNNNFESPTKKPMPKRQGTITDEFVCVTGKLDKKELHLLKLYEKQFMNTILKNIYQVLSMKNTFNFT